MLSRQLSDACKSFLVFGAIIAVGSFCLGAFSYKYKLLPLAELRSVRNAVIGSPLDSHLAVTTSQPRNSVFEAFHPHADVVMIGDSLTQGAEWKEIFPTVNIANRGIGGDRSDDILRRLPTTLETTPHKAFLMFGINDFFILQTVDATFANYRLVVEGLSEQNVQVFIQSTLECSRETCGEILDNIRALNGDLRTYASENGLPFININRGLTSKPDGLLKQYTYDGTHLLGSGYLEWSKSIESHVVGNGLVSAK